MPANESIDPAVRLAIANWPDDAPRGTVTTFCAEHAISRKSFYELRKRARTQGQAAVLEPRSRRPKTSPTKVSQETKDQAISVRAALEASGLDHGPISVHDGAPLQPPQAILQNRKHRTHHLRAIVNHPRGNRRMKPVSTFRGETHPELRGTRVKL